MAVASNNELEFQRLFETSPILRRFTYQTSFNNAFFMKDDLNDEVPNGIPKILIPSNGVVNWDGVLKLGGRLEGDHVTHLLGWIGRPIAWSLIWNCSYGDDTIEGGLMMWVSFIMDENRLKKKTSYRM